MPPPNDDTVSVVEQTSFVVSDSGGDLRPGTHHGYFAADTRFLSSFMVRLSGRRPLLLATGHLNHRRANFYLTNPKIGGLQPNRISMVREREVDDAFRERIVITNHDTQTVELRLDLEIDADFADIFEARGRRPLRRTVVHDHVGDRAVRFVYERSGYRRATTARFSRPLATGERGIHVPVSLPPGKRWELVVTVTPSANGGGSVPGRRAVRRTGTVDTWTQALPEITSADPRIERAWTQALEDVESLLLRSQRGGYIVAAGLPWFLAVFGRDAVICARQTLPLGPAITLGTLRELASYQGSTDDRFREEEPGKIPHEVRAGELSLLEELPHARYYGSVDATPLYVTLFVEACRWSGWLRGAPPGEAQAASEAMPGYLADLLPAAEAALGWVERSTREDGLLWFEQQHPRGYRIQAWKDSDDSYRFTDGTLAEAPIAAVEVQGYVYEARLGMAEVYEALGRPGEAEELRRRARRLRDAIDAGFWMAEEGFYAMGLQRDGRQIDSITSNPGHLLWSGAVSARRAASIGERLMADDMFSGWGIRTMSSRMGGYNPLSYHNGSVWPHDNSLIAAGLGRYGQAERAWRVVDGLLDSAQRHARFRLPELFAGFDRGETPHIVPYPSACSPQAWASGAIVLGVRTIASITARAGRPSRTVPQVALTGATEGQWGGLLGHRDAPARGQATERPQA